MLTLENISRFLKPVRAYFAGVFTMGFVAFGVTLLWAQDVAAPAVAASSGGGLKDQLLVMGLGLLTLAAGVIYRTVSKFINKGGDALERWVENKIQNEFLESAILRFTTLARSTVLNVWKTQVKFWKVGLKDMIKDKKITPEEVAEKKRQAKLLAMEQLKMITPKVLLDTVLGIDAKDTAIDAFLSAGIESALHDAKAEAKLVKAQVSGSAIKN